MNPDAARQSRRIHRAGRNGLIIGLFVGAAFGAIAPTAWALFGFPLTWPWVGWSGWGVVIPATLKSLILIGAVEWSLVGFALGTFLGAVIIVNSPANGSKP